MPHPGRLRYNQRRNAFIDGYTGALMDEQLSFLPLLKQPRGQVAGEYKLNQLCTEASELLESGGIVGIAAILENERLVDEHTLVLARTAMQIAQGELFYMKRRGWVFVESPQEPETE